MKTNIVLKNKNLWERIQGFSLDAENSTFPFSKKLAKEENWSLDFTKRAIEEYKKFVYLSCILPNGASPSEIVDKVWHMHLIYTQNYWEEFCPNILQQKLHHNPSKGGESENEKHKNWLDETLKSYQEIFHQEPPQDIWKTTINTSKRDKISFSGKIVLMLCCILAIYSCRENSNDGITALSLMAVFFVIIILVIRKFSKNSNTSDKENGDKGSDGFFFFSCGSNSSHGDGGSSSSCSSSCGSSCGSGCGGCGGGD
ncbi:glycine-rich domain-containing protein [Chryseobacterium aquaticum]|uniref:Glycine-rich domain-containing protein-like n=1 Tax=Chryseobacterium aquaticum subsp. greenlandense TaxID=345663 RepID=A0A117KCI3_9FLAO|nr:hypothetical protein [Chryseobacterium aquaticum]KUJ57674.1 hypothetical protein AR686_02645 [Chryseobacterium aquaticum subsp. greenlandense]